MKESPHKTAEQLKEVLCTYLETAYRISNRAVRSERGRLLREPGVVSQVPFVETTPMYQEGVWFKDLEERWIPEKLIELAEFGFPTGRSPLWAHQEAAIRAAWGPRGEPGNLIVATGTGSGKTECFYLPILADILRESSNWDDPSDREREGEWDSRRSEWLHSRQHEGRAAALRAIILYPMNALVNDQLRRLRKGLASDKALDWQSTHLRGNRIYFGRYTSQTQLAGNPGAVKRRRRWKDYKSTVENQWNTIDERLKESGGWPRLGGSEMLCRWDMQQAPPDVLITNYSMLEYMLVRPIENDIFERTRLWLESSDEHFLTLVLDEAHTYTGARGTEVAYLLRRLYERLGVDRSRIRCIATSASLGNTEEALQRIRQFSSDLFHQPPESFTVVREMVRELPASTTQASNEEIRAFAEYQLRLSRHAAQSNVKEGTGKGPCPDKWLLDQLSTRSHSDVYSGLYEVLREHPRFLDLRRRTDRHACRLDELADAIWGDLADPEDRQLATAGMLSAGGLARQGGKASDRDVPPLLPSRLHLMYRGIPGLWACFDPQCSLVHNPDGRRPCGTLYGSTRVQPVRRSARGS